LFAKRAPKTLTAESKPAQRYILAKGLHLNPVFSTIEQFAFLS
jgi:hypothetical protein